MQSKLICIIIRMIRIQDWITVSSNLVPIQIQINPLVGSQICGPGNCPYKTRWHEKLIKPVKPLSHGWVLSCIWSLPLVRILVYLLGQGPISRALLSPVQVVVLKRRLGTNHGSELNPTHLHDYNRIRWWSGQGTTNDWNILVKTIAKAHTGLWLWTTLVVGSGRLGLKARHWSPRSYMRPGIMPSSRVRQVLLFGPLISN